MVVDASICSTGTLLSCSVVRYIGFAALYSFLECVDLETSYGKIQKIIQRRNGVYRVGLVEGNIVSSDVNDLGVQLVKF